jgi:isopenicillin-N N-acyltransferase-like protein
MNNFPVLTIGGEPFNAGLSYGRNARTRIATSVLNYAALFAWCGWDWEEVKQRAQPYRAVIGDFHGEFVDEMRGIAQGAGVDINDIMALNVRTELLPDAFGQPLRRAARKLRAEALTRNAERGLDHPETSDSPAARSPYDALLAECTALAVSSQVSKEGVTYLAQNWDWLGWQRDAMVILKTAQMRTLTEAGMLAKIGVNVHGLAVGLNILKSTDDQRGEPGMPVHVALRAVLEMCTDVPAAQDLLSSFRYSASSNIICADVKGNVLSFELSPRAGCAIVTPTAGVVVHTNHFLAPQCVAYEGNLGAAISSHPRYGCIAKVAMDWKEDGVKPGIRAIKTALSLDDGTAATLARRADMTLPAELRVETVASIIIDCDTQTMHVSPNVPTAQSYTQIVH